MTLTNSPPPPSRSIATERYAKCIEASKRVHWDIDRDVIRGRQFNIEKKFLPDRLSKVGSAPFLSAAQQRFVSQIQGRTYANMFSLVERYIGAKTLELSTEHALGDQVALEALVRLTDEELKHQALFKRLEEMAAAVMPDGYAFLPNPDAVARAVLTKSSWAVLALTLDIELFTQAHYRSSIEPDPALSELWKDVFLFHWKEESQHAIIDELEWRRVDAPLSDHQRERGVDDLIDLVGDVDAIVQQQSSSDAAYFLMHERHDNSQDMTIAVRDLFLRAYRWQYIVSGVQDPRFGDVLRSMTSPQQLDRIGVALAPIMAHAA